MSETDLEQRSSGFSVLTTYFGPDYRYMHQELRHLILGLLP
jgi:hypothetical protein